MARESDDPQRPTDAAWRPGQPDGQTISGEHLPPAPRSREGTLVAPGGGGDAPTVRARPASRGWIGHPLTRVLLFLVLLMMVLTVTATVIAIRSSAPGNRALVAVGSSPSATPTAPTPTPSASASPSPAEASPSPRVAATPSASPSVQTTPAPVGGAVPTAPPGPSTTADLGQGVTMHISRFYPGTSIVFEIDNRGNNPFVLDFDTGDVTVYDDAGHAYPVTGAADNHATVGSGQQWSPSIAVKGNPTSVAKSWTVSFKAISGRQNVTIVYTLAS